MKFLLTVSATVLLVVSTSASAWRDYNDRGNWNNNWDNRGNYDSSGDTSGDWNTDVQFDVQMRGSGDAGGYVYGTLGEGWDNVQIHRYDNNSVRSGHIRDYRPSYRDGRRPNYGPEHRPYYGPGYGERYGGPQR